MKSEKIVKVLLRIITGAIIGLACALALWSFSSRVVSDIFQTFEARTLDWRYQKKIPPVTQAPVDEKIVIVDINSFSLSKLGRFQQWPRSYHTGVINTLIEDGALAVGFDILFIDPDRDRTEDESLIKATARARNVFHALVFSHADTLNFLPAMQLDPYFTINPSFSYELRPSDLPDAPRREIIEGPFIDLAKVSRGLGFTNAFADPDGVVRSIPLFVRFLNRWYPSLALEMALQLTNGSVSVKPGKGIVIKVENNETVIPVDSSGRMLINFIGNFQAFRYISYYDVLKGRLPKGFFKDKIVLIGASAPGLSDLKPVPFNPGFPGVEIHANIIHNILSGEFLRKVDLTTTFIVIIVLSTFIGALVLTLPTSLGILAAIIIWAVFSYYSAFNLFMEKRLWIEMVRPSIAFIFTFIVVTLYRYFTEEREKRRVKGFFQVYVNKEVVEELLRNPELAKLGGHKSELTILFSDVAGFTTISESMPPEQLVSFLNEYLTVMTEIVLRHRGTVDKFEGDAVMAFFGAPVPLPDHALEACKVTLDMQKELSRLNEKWIAEGKPPLKVRIGLNTGEVVVGNMGSRDKMDYTVMGDHVNLASRLEGANKQYGTFIMISEFTYNQVIGKMIVRELDRLRVKGKNEPVTIYELLASVEEGLTENASRKLDLYNKGLEFYRQQQWKEAESFFTQALEVDPDDGPSKEYIERCRDFEKEPPGSDWDGVWVMKTK